MSRAETRRRASGPMSLASRRGDCLGMHLRRPTGSRRPVLPVSWSSLAEYIECVSEQEISHRVECAVRRPEQDVDPPRNVPVSAKAVVLSELMDISVRTAISARVARPVRLAGAGRADPLLLLRSIAVGENSLEAQRIYV